MKEHIKLYRLLKDVPKNTLLYDAIKVKIALLKLGDALGESIKKGFIQIKW